MNAIAERFGACEIMANACGLPDGRSVVTIEIVGPVSSSGFVAFLERLVGAGMTPAQTRAIIDLRQAQQQSDAGGLFQQAMVLARAKVRHLTLCYVADVESASAFAPMVIDIFQEAGLSITVGVCRTQDDALAWMAAQP
jgi:hypothetical protein